MPKMERLLPCPKCSSTDKLTHDQNAGKVFGGYRHVRCGCGYVGPGRNDAKQAVKAFNRVPRKGLEYTTKSLRCG